MKYFYHVAGQSVGPVEMETLFALKREGKVSGATLVWSEGSPVWRPLSEVSPEPPPLPSAASVATPPPVPAAMPASRAPSAEISCWEMSPPRPYYRLAARLIDNNWVGLVVASCVAFVWMSLSSDLAATTEMLNNRIVSQIGLVAAMVPVQAFFLGVMGTTFGKWIAGVRVRNADGSHLTFGQAIKREAKVWTEGLALGIPLISLITMDSSRKKLLANGQAPWDSEGGHVVEYRPKALWRQVLIWVAVLGGYVLIAAMSAMK